MAMEQQEQVDAVGAGAAAATGEGAPFLVAAGEVLGNGFRTSHHHFHDRLQSFTDFLIHNLGDWSKKQPPWPSPPHITFTGSDSTIRGRLPHKKIALSSLRPFTSPFSSAKPPDSEAAGELTSLLSPELHSSFNISGAPASSVPEAPLVPSRLLCSPDHLQGSASIPACISQVSSAFDIAAVATSLVSSEYHSSTCRQGSELVSASKFELSSELQPLYELAGVPVSSSPSGIHSSDDSQGSKFASASESSPSSDLHSSSDVAGAISTFGPSESHSSDHPQGGELTCWPTSVYSSPASFQSADSNYLLPLEGLIAGPANVTTDSLLITPLLTCAFDEQDPSSPSRAPDFPSSTVPNTNSSSYDSGSTSLPSSMETSHLGPERSNVDSPRRIGNLVSDERGLTKQRVDLEVVGSPGDNQEDRQLEDGELSGEWTGQECSEDNGSAQTSNGNDESSRPGERLYDVCESTGQQFSMAQTIAGVDAGFHFPHYYTRSSVRKGGAGGPDQKRKLNDLSDEKNNDTRSSVSKGGAGGPDQKRKLNDSSDEKNKKNQGSIKRKRSKRQKPKTVSQAASAGRGAMGKGWQQLAVQKAIDKASTLTEMECTKHVKQDKERKVDGKGIQEEAKVKASGPSEGPEYGEVVPVPEKKKGLLSMLVEGEVGLWTTDAGDEQILITQTEEVDGKKKKRIMTAERKKKKQRAKHRKRAEKEKTLGIRRLRLKSPQKKVVPLCQFYIKGRCSKGKNCPFSHDTVPITKSEVCKYYLNRCCLKGDDCPFSHDPSSHPCKFFHTRGYCLDGDSCRFSHKPITEEAYQNLLIRVEQEHQARQESGMIPKDTISGKVTYPAVTLSAEDSFGLQELETSRACVNSCHPSVVDESSQICTPPTGYVYRSSVNVNLEDGDRKMEGKFSLSRTNKSAFAVDDENRENAVLLAARKAACMSVAVSSAGRDTGIFSSPLLHTGAVGTTGTSLNKDLVADMGTDAVVVSMGTRMRPSLIASTSKAAGLSVTGVAKSSAMELLQASLEASEVAMTSEPAARIETLSGSFSTPNYVMNLPKGHLDMGTSASVGSIAEVSSASVTGASKTSSMEHLQASLKARQVDLATEECNAGIKILSPTVSTSSFLLNLTRVHSGTPSPSAANKRPSVDSLLSRILMG